MPINVKPLKLSKKTKLLTLITLLGFSIFISTTTISVFAGCAEIQDDDDRAECYGDKVEKKEKEYESISKKLEDIRDAKDGISNTIAGYLADLSVTQEQIDDLQSEIDDVKEQLDIINDNLSDRKGKLFEKISFRNNIIRTYSKRAFTSDLELFFAFNPFSTDLNGFQYGTFSYMLNKSLSENALELIHLLSSEIEDFEKDKAEGEKLKDELEDAQNSLLSLKADIDAKKASAQSELNVLDSEETEYENELGDLAQEISELSAKQQSILNAKYGTENGSVGDYEPPSASTPDSPFDPGFAAFSYGAYTHYKGMSQYGAKGRAEDGKDYKDILEFYYKVGVTEKDMGEICVEGYGNMSFNKYLYGLAEMPSTWPEDALKAQAIAGRSYAYRFYEQGKCICTTQSCQVFLKSKSDNPPDRWKDAVKDTEDKILKDGVVAYYSSTTGGHIQDVGWDIDGGSWPNTAYEKKAGSPWFRKAWYTKSYNNSDSCGRAHPWLDEEEMADIINAWRVWTKGSDSEVDRISPVTTSCWGGNPYSLDGMRDKADDYGTAYKKVTSMDVEISNGGYTSKVILETDKGTVEIDGQTFKTVFNLRAPSYIAIRSQLFDFEKD